MAERAEPLLLKPRDAARMLGLTTKQLAAEIAARNLRYVRIGKGRRRYFARPDLDEFIERKRREWESDAASLDGARIRRSPTATSRSKVIGFEEALKRTTPSSPKRSPRGSGSGRSSDPVTPFRK